MDVPKVLTLSAMDTMAFWVCDAAFSVSPPRLLMSAAEKLVACSMYWFALMPHVAKAP